MEIPEEEHFEDFTTASEWETFTANLERVIIEWQSRPFDPENIMQQWGVLHEKVSFAEFPFKFSYYKKLTPVKNDVMTNSSIGLSSASSNGDLYPPYIQSALSKESDAFPPKYAPHKIADYFDIKEFAILTSAGPEPIHNESKFKALLSSACLAVNNTSTNFPIFVQYHPWSQNFFCGIAESNGTRTSFQMVHLKHVPNQHKYLSGLLSIFKSRMNPTLTASVGVTAHFFYTMHSWHPKHNLDSFPPELLDEIGKTHQASEADNEDEGSGQLAASNNNANDGLTFSNLLPFGSIDDPYEGLEFVAGWPYLTEDVVVDSPSYSDLEPINAPEWHFRLRPHTQAEFRLHDLVEGIWKLYTENRTVEEILGKKLEVSGDKQYISALERLALANSPIPTPINRVLHNVNKAQKQLLFSPSQYQDLPPLQQDQLDTILPFLFPDATPDPKYPYPASFDRQPEFAKEHIAALAESFQGVKSAPMGGLVWRLAVVLGYLNAYSGYTGAVAHLWAEFILELRYRWENSIEIPGLERGAPNSGTCLFNQKLQMLNCCIEKKIAREKKENEKSSLSDGIESPIEDSEGEDEDDEFFDCDDNVASPAAEGNGASKMNTKPVGRLRKCGRLRLLKTGEPMYIPITQDPAPLTEDVVEEQAKILVELGNDAEGSELRAKMMSASLLSDMESFKAANPGAVLDDFVRWYSPRDWIESDELDEFGNPKGTLSARMKVPGNLWGEVWTNAQPVPARRQKRLFDDTREAEKVLHWMSSCRLKDISQLIFPCLIHAATLKVLEEADKLSVEFKIPTTLLQQVTQLTRLIIPATAVTMNHANDTVENNVNSYRSSVMSSISRCEKEITQIRSFQQKFPQLDLNQLLKRKAGGGGGGEVGSDSELEGSFPSSSSADVELIPNYIKVDGGVKSPVAEVIKEVFQMEHTRYQNVEPSSENNEFKFGEPVRRVFILRYCPAKTTTTGASSSSDHYNQEETLPQRMSCLIRKEEFLLAGTFTTRTDLG